MSAATFSGLEWRGIGPALMSGRIADIAVHPQDQSVWYVAVGSGGVWKTTNAGTTWESIFDGQPSYSIGDVTLDPSNPEIVWVGTGENVSGRHVGYGDGVYKSMDGGASWEQDGARGLRAHRQHHRRPERRQHRLRRRAGAALVRRWRPGPVQDHRRRRQLGEDPRRRRVHGRQRGLHGPARLERPLRRDPPALPHRGGSGRWRSRVRHPQVDRRRRDLA